MRYRQVYASARSPLPGGRPSGHRMQARRGFFDELRPSDPVATAFMRSIPLTTACCGLVLLLAASCQAPEAPSLDCSTVMEASPSQESLLRRLFQAPEETAQISGLDSVRQDIAGVCRRFAALADSGGTHVPPRASATDRVALLNLAEAVRQQAAVVNHAITVLHASGPRFVEALMEVSSHAATHRLRGVAVRVEDVPLLHVPVSSGVQELDRHIGDELLRQDTALTELKGLADAARAPGVSPAREVAAILALEITLVDSARTLLQATHARMQVTLGSQGAMQRDSLWEELDRAVATFVAAEASHAAFLATLTDESFLPVGAVLPDQGRARELGWHLRQLVGVWGALLGILEASNEGLLLAADDSSRYVATQIQQETGRITDVFLALERASSRLVTMQGAAYPVDSLRHIGTQIQHELLRQRQGLVVLDGYMQAVQHLETATSEATQGVLGLIRQTVARMHEVQPAMDNAATLFFAALGTGVQEYGGKTILAILVVIASFFLIRGAIWLLETLSERSAARRLFYKKLVPIGRLLIWGITIYVILAEVYQVDSRGLLAAMTAIGVAIGFAAQDVLKNIFGGILIIFDQPFQVGDKIRVGGTYGEVVSMGLRSTRIVTPDDNLVTVPNSQVVENQVANANSGSLDCQVVVELFLPGWVDVTRAKAIAFSAAANSKYVYLEKPIVVNIRDEFKETFLTQLTVKAYVLDTRYEFALASDITEAAKTEFLREGFFDAIDAIDGALKPIIGKDHD